MIDVLEAIRSRKSIRGFKADPVPKEVLRSIIEIALRSPSAMNSQPWEFTIIAGEVLENIKKGNMAKLESGAMPCPDHPMQAFAGVYRQRQVDLAVQLFQLMGITREDRAKRGEWMKRGFRFFDAPAAIVLAVDRSIKPWWELFDLGAISQTICLAALQYGLGTCIEDQGVMFPDVIRQYTSIPEQKRIIICIAVGYPASDFPANRLQSERVTLEDVTTWCGFD